MLGTRLPAHLPPPAQQPPAKPGRDHRPAPRDRRRPPGAAAGAVAERAPVAPRQPEDQQQQQAERRGRNHRHRQRQRPEPGRDQEPLHFPAEGTAVADAASRCGAVVEHRQRQRRQRQRRRQQRQLQQQRLQRPVEQQAQRPAKQHQRDCKGGNSQALAQQVGEHRPVVTEKIMRSDVDRGVERRIPRIVGNQRRRSQQRRQQQPKAQHFEEPPPQRRPRSRPRVRAARPDARGQADRSGHASPDAGRCPQARRGCRGTHRHPRRGGTQHILPADKRQCVARRVLEPATPAIATRRHARYDRRPGVLSQFRGLEACAARFSHPVPPPLCWRPSPEPPSPSIATRRRAIARRRPATARRPAKQ